MTLSTGVVVSMTVLEQRFYETMINTMNALVKEIERLNDNLEKRSIEHE